MIAPLAKLIEWASVQATFTKMPHPEGNLGLDEAIQFLNGPDFMSAESQPAQLVFNNAPGFHFPTHRKALADVGTTRHLAAAVWPHQLDVCAELDGARA